MLVPRARRHEVRERLRHDGRIESPLDLAQVREVLLAAGARVVGMATEAEVRADLGLAADLAWLRTRRRALIESLTTALT